MPLASAVFLLCGTLLLACGGAAPAEELPFRDGTTWCGDPDAVQTADNPYVKLAEQNVTRALQHPDFFWYTWGYAAPESSRRGNADLRARMVTELDKLTEKLAATPSAYWDILPALECMRMLKKVPDFPQEQVAAWLAQLRPSAQANYDGNAQAEAWMSVAPNTLHQSSAILQLASQLYEEPKYAEMAKRLVHAAGAYQEPDGAFRYIRNSGPCQVYYGFDATFLGRYYQLSRDPEARDQLVRMAKYSQDALANGLMEGASAPWWKHHWGTGGPIHGVEIVAGLSRDPLTRSVAELRLRGAQPYYFSYYCMYFWDPTIPHAPLAPDLCRYNTNIAGPQLRSGSWQVVMPGKAYADTGIGCSIVTGAKPFAFDAYLEVAALPVLGKGVTQPYARPGAFLIAGPEELDTRATLVGDGWIAAGWTFAPRHSFYGDPASPPAPGWRLAQVWFADTQGLAGQIAATCTAASGVLSGPRGYLSFGHPATLDSRNALRLTAGRLVAQLWGEQVQTLQPVATQPGNAWASATGLWVNLAGVSERAYQAGERFTYGLSACPAGTTPPQVRLLPAGALVAVQVTRIEGPPVTVLFNPQPEPVTPPALGITARQVWSASGPPGVATPRPVAGGPLTLQPHELMVLIP